MKYNILKFSFLFLIIFFLINTLPIKASEEKEDLDSRKNLIACSELRDIEEDKYETMIRFSLPSVFYLIEITQYLSTAKENFNPFKCLEAQQEIHASSQAQREKLANLIDFRILTQLLRLKIKKLEEDNAIKGAILAAQKNSKEDTQAPTTSYIESFRNYFFGSSKPVNQDEVESNLSDNLKVSIINRNTLPRILLKEKSIVLQQKSSPPKKLMDQVIKELKMLIKQEDKSLVPPLHKYIFSKSFFSDDNLDKELDALLISYQGIKKAEKEQSLLNQYQRALALSLELDFALEENQLDEHFSTLEEKSLKVAPTEICLTNTEEELDGLKDFNLFELRSLSLTGSIFSLDLVKRLKLHILGRMKNLVALSLDFESFESQALGQLLASLKSPLTTLGLGSNLDSETLKELLNPLDGIKLEQLTIQSKKKHQNYMGALNLVLFKIPYLKKLDVSDNTNISSAMILLGLAMSTNHNLKELSFRNIGLNSINLSEFIASLPFHVSLRTIDIRGNSEVSSFDIFCIQQQYPNIKILFSKQEERPSVIEQYENSLHINFTRETSQELEKVDLSEGLKSIDFSKVVFLSLTGEVLDSQLGYSLYMPLLKMMNLRFLSLEFGGFEPSVLGILLNGLPKSLMALKIGSNLEYERFKEIRGYEDIHLIEEFTLPAWRQDNKYAKKLAKTLSKMKGLRTLNLQSNHNLIYGLNLVFSSLQDMTCLQKLNLQNTGLEWRHLKPAIDDMPNSLKEIKEVNLSNNLLELTPIHPHLNERLQILQGAFSKANLLLYNGKRAELFDRQSSDEEDTADINTFQELLIPSIPDAGTSK
ncbi:MAG: hypothetical protein BGO76_08560 [Caedibacter sp. 38-128]|nr:hypothetical protein [Holosporales bacterium]OJX08106.1 MAG: hypothetical protein BGO76_08560 [Caedibacter sp. 38-128]